MAPPFSSSPFDFTQIDHYGLSTGEYGKQEPTIDHFGLWRDLNPVVYHNQQPKLNFFLDDLHFNSNSLPLLMESTSTQQMLPNYYSSSSSLSSSWELLNSYGTGFKKLKGERISGSIVNETVIGSKSRLSAEEIMRAAGAKFIQCSSKRDMDISDLNQFHPYGSCFSGVCEEDARDVELAVLLLAAAEKVGYSQFDRGSKLLTHCEWIASQKANTAQKIVFHFAEALRERINRETGKVSSRSVGLETEKAKIAKNEIEEGLSTNLTSLTCYLQIPFLQVVQFTGIQSIIENIAVATKIHLVDLEIRSGVQWTVLMEALTERKDRPIERLTVTAVGITRNKHKIDETGRRLVGFAESKSLPFLFKTVLVSDLEDLNEELFEIEKHETVAIYSPLILRTLIARPSCLENLMGVLRNLNPSVMILIEVEANHNSPSFVGRFIEALFYYSAYFECLEACMDDRDEHRLIVEAVLRDGIENMVAAEGSERRNRNVKVEVWRAFFRRFRMVEIGFSESSEYQASLVAKKFGRGSWCTVDKNGKCLTVGWKGTPINSVSAWKFR